MQRHLNFEYEASSTQKAELIRSKVKTILIMHAITAYVLLVFFFEPVALWLGFSPETSREGMFFIITGYPGLAMLKLTEVELMSVPEKGENKQLSRLSGPIVSAVLTIMIFGFQWFTSMAASTGASIGLIITLG